MKDDFSGLENMIYSGRGITIGMTPDRKPFVGYTLTGRSHSSQARKLVYANPLKSIVIGITDEKILREGNPSLLVYSTMEFIEDVHSKIIASNGKQTSIISRLAYKDNNDTLSPLHLLIQAHESKVIENGIDLTTYEPDAPNFTPRISGCVDNNSGAFYMVKKMPNSDKPYTKIFTQQLIPGQARTLTTYDGGNETPLVSFNRNEPLFASIVSNTVHDICESLYAAIGPKGNDNYRIAA
ncbi:MAG: IMP cyclohydrolase, partial [Candidatus Woesearchaeota archaeon]